MASNFSPNTPSPLDWLFVTTKHKRLTLRCKGKQINASLQQLFNHSQPTGHVMHQQFNIQQLYVLPTLCVFYIYLRTNGNFCPIQNKLIGFYNRDEVFTARYGLIPYIKQIMFRL